MLRDESFKPTVCVDIYTRYTRGLTALNDISILTEEVAHLEVLLLRL